MLTRLRTNNRLRGISKTPLWLLIFFAQAFPMGGIIVMTLLVAADDNRLYYLIGCLAGLALFITAVCHCVVSLRLSGLAAMMQQDPHVIVGDPACLLKLSRIPWYGVSEVDLLQLSIVQTYNNYSLDSKRNGRSGKVSHSVDDVEKVEWQSAISDEDDYGGKKFNAVSEYLKNQESAAAGVYVAPLMGPSPALPISEKSRATSFVSRWFTPRSHAGSYPSAPSVTGGDDDVRQDGFYSIPNSVDENSVLVPDSRKVTASFQSQNIQSNSQFATPYSTSDFGVKQTKPASEQAGVAVMTTMKTFDTADVASYDPLDDNNASWEILQRGLKLQSSIFVQLISSLRVGQSLSSVTLPVHILESRSLLEMLADMFVHWEILLPIARGEIIAPVDRMVEMFKWFISAYHVKPKGAKKPYNPILGEVWRGDFTNTTNTSAATSTESLLEVIAEQVSHHPPVSALFAQLSDLIEIHVVYAPKSKFVSLNCAASIGEGGVSVFFPKVCQRYNLTFPSAYVSGIIAGTPTLELGGTVTISDLTDKQCHADLEFLRKGWISGSYDQMHCRVYHGDKRAIKEFSGTWYGKIYEGGPMKDGKDSSPKSGAGSRKLFLDPATLGLRRPRTKLLRGPGGADKVSRVIWKDLTVSLRQGDAVKAAEAKHKVETIQRAERKQLAAENRTHANRYFKFNGSHHDEDHSAMVKTSNWEFIARDLLEQH